MDKIKPLFTATAETEPLYGDPIVPLFLDARVSFSPRSTGPCKAYDLTIATVQG